MTARPMLVLTPLVLLFLFPAIAAGQGFGDVPLADTLEVIVLEGQILAIDATGGGQLTRDLHLNEEVIWSGASGRLGAVITNERLLTTSVGASSWRELRFELAEQRPSRALLGDRVGMVVTTKRALGFDSESGQIFEYRLGPREEIVATQAGRNIGVVVTSRNAIGLSTTGGFAEIRIQLKERFQSLSVRSDIVTVQTTRRLLIFKGPTRSWSEKRLQLRQSG